MMTVFGKSYEFYEGEGLELEGLLRCFELVSGLKVNFYKSKVVRRIQRYASFLKCKIMTIPFGYLRMEVRGNPRKERKRCGEVCLS